MIVTKENIIKHAASTLNLFKKTYKQTIPHYIKVHWQLFTAFILGIIIMAIANHYIDITTLLDIIPKWLVAIAGFAGLSTWKNKLKYERTVGLVDEIYEHTNLFITRAQPIVEILKYIKISIDAYHETGKHKDNSSIERLISTKGRRYSEQLKTNLDSLPMQKILSLTNKAWALHIDRYELLQQSCTQLEWFYNSAYKIAFLFMLDDSWNWENPEVISRLDQLNLIDPNKFRSALSDAHTSILAFAKEIYKNINS